MHIDAIERVRARGEISRRLLGQRMRPVLLHPFDPLRDDQLARMLLRIAMNRRIPILPYQLIAPSLPQPLKRPLIMPAEIVAPDHSDSPLAPAAGAEGLGV